MLQPRFWIVALLILAPAALRLVDHPWNVAPIGALALFVGAHFRGKSWAFLVPLIAMFASDVALGIKNNDTRFYTFHAMVPVTYGCFALYVWLGLGVRRFWDGAAPQQPDREHIPTPHHGLRRSLPVAGATLAGSLLFFLLTNLGMWAAYDTYPKTINGLIECYSAGLPFFRSTLAGDAFYVTVLFGGYAVLKDRLPANVHASLRAENT